MIKYNKPDKPLESYKKCARKLHYMIPENTYINTFNGTVRCRMCANKMMRLRAKRLRIDAVRELFERLFNGKCPFEVWDLEKISPYIMLKTRKPVREKIEIPEAIVNKRR